MDNSRKIQFGVLGVVALLFVANLMGAFDGILGKKDASADDARAAVTANAGDVSPTNAATTKAAPAEPAAPVGPLTTLKFDKNEFDYGVIDQGEKVTHIYKFTNTGSEPLIISNAKGSCGCTVPQWPKDPIMPGTDGEIKVQFDSKGKRGKQSKRVTITANTDPAQTFLTIKGEINAPEGDAAIKPQPIKPAAPAQK